MAEDDAGMPAASESAPGPSAAGPVAGAEATADAERLADPATAAPAEGAPSPTAGADPLRPAIEVLGGATPEQIAALLSVLSAAGSAEVEPAPRRRSDWAAYEAGIRRPPHPGPGVWRSSLRRT